MSVADLLRTEIEVIWPTDGRGRFRGPQHMVISVSADGRHQVPAVADHLPDALAADLLDGKLGPWAMALDPADPARVVSICHTPCWTDHGAEAGTWTRPGHRGRGHAATVTAAWSRLQAPTGRHLFYSTSDTNRSSRNVAARLGLAPLGHLWKLSPPASIAL
ncbi:hypothetical protein DMH15_30385 [Streptomyces sp. WAC 06725]|uniref:GNAT family N-acetyltransferase n=1 Tax=Streptomyces sp. WAC 06725 TaxID=2203209 RepID=UPI000F74970D|nr:GNAT family protein [Streptomyces sp. WAC 06725]RSO25385.1 hypothetical protein DMH15_30385 [Streptomyces sp. WAC 06725]